MKKMLCRALTVILFLLLALHSSALIYENTVKAICASNFYFEVNTAYSASGYNDGYKIIALDDVNQEDVSQTPDQTIETSIPSEVTPESTENPNGPHITDVLPIIAVGAVIIVVITPIIMRRNRTYLVSFGQVGVGHEYTGTVLVVDGVDYDKFGISFWWKDKSIHNFMYLTRLDGSTGRQYVLSSVSGVHNDRNYIKVNGNNAIVGNYNLQLKTKVFEERPNPKRPFYTP
jgi:hypothetical protein